MFVLNRIEVVLPSSQYIQSVLFEAPILVPNLAQYLARGIVNKVLDAYLNLETKENQQELTTRAA